MNERLYLLGSVLLTTLAFQALTQCPDWQHQGSLSVLTTPEGGDLSATALEHDFPLLVRLKKGTFVFAQAKDSGEDIRFSS